MKINRKILVLFMLSLTILSLTFPSSISEETKGIANKHNITIETQDGKFSIEEKIVFNGSGNGTYQEFHIYLPSDLEKQTAIFNGNEVNSYNQKEGNLYIYNLSELNITKENNIQVTITYQINKEEGVFNKTLYYFTDSLSVTFDQDKIYTGKNLENNSYFSLQLYKPSEQPLSLVTILFILLLIIVLIVSTFYSFKKRKSSIKKEIRGGSKEYLETKKTLLMSLLKEVEKKHRSDKISDDTYHKLKDQFKQDTIQTMKKLDDLKSESK